MNIVNQEEISPPEETTMLLWDPSQAMSSDDLFEVQEPPVEVLVVKTQSRGQPVSNELTMTKFREGDQLLITLKNLFLPEMLEIFSLMAKHEAKEEDKSSCKKISVWLSFGWARMIAEEGR
jgi:hypothetical protein